jgi:small GTP-binding protein
VHRILDPAADAQLRNARDLLASVRDALVRFDAAPSDQQALVDAIRQLDDLFLIVVVGEFNAGKSAFVNALLGQPVLAEGVTPTTAEIQLLKYGETTTERRSADGFRELTAPVDLLRDLHIVDTPGTNAILREHERLTSDFVPRADLVLFVTSADRPFTETERHFMETIRGWGKGIVVVVNKIDILAGAAEIEEVCEFVRSGARQLLGADPLVLPVSARLALRAKQGEPSRWAESRFEALEQYLSNTLDAPARFRLKLANPLGIASALSNRYRSVAEERLALIHEDVDVLGDIDRQLDVYRHDLDRGFELRLAGIEKELGEMVERGRRFFEDTLRIGRVVDLLNRARIQKEFEERVVGDVPAQIESRVSELIDWLIDQDLRQWQAITNRLAARRRDGAGHVLGAPEVGTFHTDRARLIESAGRTAQQVVESYDRRREAEVIADQARVAVAAAAAAGGAAVGLGTLVTIAASTVAADVTGILLASLVLGVGFLIIPARRKRARATLEEKVSALRHRLASALRAEFDRARERSQLRLTDAVAPYSRFVRTQENRWRTATSVLRDLASRSETMRAALDPAGARR